VSHDSARVRLSADAPQAQVLTSLALVLGARCDLSIEQIDDLVMALELLREQPTRAREVRFNADDGLEVVVEDVTDKLLDERGQMLSVLVSDVRREAGAVRLRVI
jgi:hypothetical protein